MALLRRWWTTLLDDIAAGRVSLTADCLWSPESDAATRARLHTVDS